MKQIIERRKSAASPCLRALTRSRWKIPQGCWTQCSAMRWRRVILRPPRAMDMTTSAATRWKSCSRTSFMPTRPSSDRRSRRARMRCRCACSGCSGPATSCSTPSGGPYDTLEDVIGVRGCPPGSLREMGVSYAEVPMGADGRLDLAAIRAAMKPRTRVVAVQRSRGYSSRPSLMPEDVAPLSDMLKRDFPDAALMVDNCYGEFVCTQEPTDFGADVCVGSLIKNPGGGLAPTGGYIVGRQDVIDRVSFRLTAPGIGREVGSYAGSYQPFYQGLFLAPHVVAQAVRTSVLAAAVCEALGMRSTPARGPSHGYHPGAGAGYAGEADRLLPGHPDGLAHRQHGPAGAVDMPATSIRSSWRRARSSAARPSSSAPTRPCASPTLLSCREVSRTATASSPLSATFEYMQKKGLL